MVVTLPDLAAADTLLTQIWVSPVRLDRLAGDPLEVVTNEPGTDSVEVFSLGHFARKGMLGGTVKLQISSHSNREPCARIHGTLANGTEITQDGQSSPQVHPRSILVQASGWGWKGSEEDERLDNLDALPPFHKCLTCHGLGLLHQDLVEFRLVIVARSDSKHCNGVSTPRIRKEQKD